MKNRKYLCKNAQSLNLFRQSLRVPQVDLDCRYPKYHNFSNRYYFCRCVGGIPSLTQNSTTTISCVSSKIRKALTLNNNPLFLTYHPIGVMIAIMVYEVRHLDRGLVVVVLTSASFGKQMDIRYMNGFYADLAASHPIKAFFLADPQRY